MRPPLRQCLVYASLAMTTGVIGRAPLVAQDVSNDPVRWFQKAEQALMDAVAIGDKRPWDNIMDERCIATTEEGRVMTKAEFLADLRPLPPGLTGEIAVRDITVQAFPGFAVVRFLADERQSVFGQPIATRYRVTDTYRRHDRAWKMVASHVSVVTNDPPPQKVATDDWPGLTGTYRLLPDGWIVHVVLRDGELHGGRDPARLRRFIPLTPHAFVLEGALGEWMFVIGENRKATHVLSFRKFEPLVWTRVGDAR